MDNFNNWMHHHQWADRKYNGRKMLKLTLRRLRYQLEDLQSRTGPSGKVWLRRPKLYVSCSAKMEEEGCTISFMRIF
jgi:hypothetical protein